MKKMIFHSIFILLLTVFISGCATMDTARNFNNLSENDKNKKLIIAVLTENLKTVQKLLNKGVDVNAKNEKGVPVLMLNPPGEHSYGKAYDIFKLLVEHGADVNAKDSDGRTPLMAVAFLGHPIIVKILIDHGADVNIESLSGETAILSAARNERYRAVKVLMKNGAQIPDSGDARIGFNEAICFGFTDKLQELLEQGFNVNKKNRKGDTPIIIAAKMKYTDMIEMLIKHGADVNAKTNSGWTALLDAVGSLDIVKLLVEHGADVNYKWESKISAIGGTNALISAVCRRDKDVVIFLIENGADVNAIVGSSYEVRESFYKISKSRNAKTETIGTRVRYIEDGNNATRIGKRTFIDPDSRDAGTPLIAAVLNGDLDIVKVLLQNGAKINKVDASGYTALMWAANLGHIDIAKLLLDNGADVNAEDFTTRTTAFEQAKENGHSDIVKLLRNHGAI